MKRNIAATFRPALRAQKTRAKPETLRTATEEKLEKKNVWLGCDGSEGGNVGGSGEGLVPPAPQFVKQWTPVMTSTSVTKVIA